MNTICENTLILSLSYPHIKTNSKPRHSAHECICSTCFNTTRDMEPQTVVNNDATWGFDSRSIFQSNMKINLSFMQVNIHFYTFSIRLFRFPSKCWIILFAENTLSCNYDSHMSENNSNKNLHTYSQWHRFHYTASCKFVCCCLTDSIFYLPSFI